MRIKHLFAARKAGHFLRHTVRTLVEWRGIKKVSQHMGASRTAKHDRSALKAYLTSTTIVRIF